MSSFRITRDPRPPAGGEQGAPRSSTPMPRAPRRATTTRSSGGSSAATARKASRTQRFTRLRSTALAILEDTVIPIRGCAPPVSSPEDDDVARVEPNAALLDCQEVPAAPQSRQPGEPHLSVTSWATWGRAACGPSPGAA